MSYSVQQCSCQVGISKELVTQVETKESESYYATEDHIQVQDDTLVLGLKSDNSELIAALALPCTEAR